MNLIRRVVFASCLSAISGLAAQSISYGEKPATASESADENHAKVDLRRFKVPTDQQRKLLRDWILDLQSRNLMVDRLAVAVTGEKYIGAKVGGAERIVARRFAFTWIVDHPGDRERLVFADQSLLGTFMKPVRGAYLIDSQASAYDQLRTKHWFHGATGTQVHTPSTSKSLNERFKLCGVFDPICATTGGVISIATGNAFHRSKCQLHAKNLIGVYGEADLAFAAFEYRPVPELIFVRVAVFRRSSPVQIDDFVSLGSDLVQVAELGDQRGQQELSSLHKILKLHARTKSTWADVNGMQLPLKLHALTLGGVQDFEVHAKFEWKLDSQIPDSVFAVEKLGVVSPLAVWADER